LHNFLGELALFCGVLRLRRSPWIIMVKRGIQWGYASVSNWALGLGCKNINWVKKRTTLSRLLVPSNTTSSVA
jgi:hypothetical protein